MTPRCLKALTSRSGGRGQQFIKQPVRSLVGVSATGTRGMDNLPMWVVTIAAVAVGVSPGLAILSAGSIARLI